MLGEGVFELGAGLVELLLSQQAFNLVGEFFGVESFRFLRGRDGGSFFLLLLRKRRKRQPHQPQRGSQKEGNFHVRNSGL
jgi:hypothetical protein